MACNISTGFVRPVGRGCVPANDLVIASPGKIILFSPETPQGTVYSPTFTVSSGLAVLLDAYNLPVDKHIYVNRIVKSTTAPAVGDTCDPCAMGTAFDPAGVIVFRERMTLGNPDAWQLVKTAAGGVLQLLIVVPGTYELELEDTTMLGDMEVEYMAWSVETMPDLPSSYFAGIVGA